MALPALPRIEAPGEGRAKGSSEMIAVPIVAKVANLPCAWLRTTIVLAILLPSILTAADSVKIGLLAPPQESEIVSIKQGVVLAVEDAKCELVFRGRPGQWGTDGDEAAALALDESASAMIAPPDGSASHQVMQVAGRTRIPVATLCSDSSVTGTGTPWVVRVAPQIDLQAQTIFTNYPRQIWAAFVPDGRAGREAEKDLRNAAKTSGCTLQSVLTLPAEKTAWPATTKSLLATRADAILLWLDPPSAGEIARQVRQLGYKGMLAGPSRLNSPLFLINATTAAQGFVIPTTVSNPSSAFVEKYRARFGSDPDFTAMMAYDAASLLTQILHDSGDQPAYRAFPLKKEYTGATGPLVFDKDGNRHFDLRLSILSAPKR